MWLSTKLCVWGWQPYHLHVPIFMKSGSLNLLEPSRPVQACNGVALPLPLTKLYGVTCHKLQISLSPWLRSAEDRLRWDSNTGTAEMNVHTRIICTPHCNPLFFPRLLTWTREIMYTDIGKLVACLWTSVVSTYLKGIWLYIWTLWYLHTCRESGYLARKLCNFYILLGKLVTYLWNFVVFTYI